MIIGAVLFITICGTMIVMDMLELSLERISLGALIIALGMLVDNAIVITEGMLVAIQRGVDRMKAAKDIVKQTAVPAARLHRHRHSRLRGDRPVRRQHRGILPLALHRAAGGAGHQLAHRGHHHAAVLLSFPERQTGGGRGRTGGAGEGSLRRFPVCRLQGLPQLLPPLPQADDGRAGPDARRCPPIGFRFIDQSFFPDSTRRQFMIDVWSPVGIRLDEATAQSGRNGGVREIAGWRDPRHHRGGPGRAAFPPDLFAGAAGHRLRLAAGGRGGPPPDRRADRPRPAGTHGELSRQPDRHPAVSC